MYEEEARRIAIEESYELKKPKDKEEKRFLRIVAHFDDLLFKESLLGEPIKEGDKSATLPLKFKLQGEGMFSALFFHLLSLGIYVILLLMSFWFQFNPDSLSSDKALFASPIYPVVAVMISASILAIVPVFFIRRYIIYPEGYLFVRVHNFLLGYWLTIVILLILDIVKTVFLHLSGSNLAGKIITLIYQLIDQYSTLIPVFFLVMTVICVMCGLMLFLITRKDFLNAIGFLLFAAGLIFGILAMLLYKYGYTAENAKWLVFYLFNYMLSAFSDKAGIAALLIPLSTYFLFKKRVNDLYNKMYRMPYT